VFKIFSVRAVRRLAEECNLGNSACIPQNCWGKTFENPNPTSHWTALSAVVALQVENYLPKKA